jgi:hypothetical protein
MNFIVGFFLYHCEEHVAFWLFVSLFEEYQVREIYLDGIKIYKYSLRASWTIYTCKEFREYSQK